MGCDISANCLGIPGIHNVSLRWSTKECFFYSSYMTEFAQRDLIWLYKHVYIGTNSQFRTLTDYNIITTYSVTPTFLQSLKPIVLSCISNEGQTPSGGSQVVGMQAIPEV